MDKSVKLKQHLIVFSRYPEAGKTKTRLIPTLGSVGAANLQRQMTEYTLFQIKQLLASISVSVEVRYTGGNLELMEQWLGTDLIYCDQGEGDLGQRMGRSLYDAFEQGAQKVVIIGTDCPSLDSQILERAYLQLEYHDIVLGPAVDGGYYLIGLGRYIRELFINIDWGTGNVMQQTVDIAYSHNLSTDYLPIFPDVDRPEDLPTWEKIFPQK